MNEKDRKYLAEGQKSGYVCVCLCVCGMSQKPRKEYFKERVINNIECQSEMKKDEDEKTFI